MREELYRIASLTIRHHPDSTIAALLLVGWLASRLHWRVGSLTTHLGDLTAKAHAHRQDIVLSLQAAPDQCGPAPRCAAWKT